MEYTELLEKQIIGRLRVDNPWWTEGEIPDFYQDMQPRLYLDIFYSLVTNTDLKRTEQLLKHKFLNSRRFIPAALFLFLSLFFMNVFNLII